MNESISVDSGNYYVTNFVQKMEIECQAFEIFWSLSSAPRRRMDLSLSVDCLVDKNIFFPHARNLQIQCPYFRNVLIIIR